MEREGRVEIEGGERGGAVVNLLFLNPVRKVVSNSKILSSPKSKTSAYPQQTFHCGAIGKLRPICRWTER